MSDIDEGANHLLNTPELGIRDGAIEGTLHAQRAGIQYRIEFFQSTLDKVDGEAPHPFKTLGGIEYVDSVTVTTDGSGFATFQAPSAVTVPGSSETEVSYVTATATEIGESGELLDTSEYSAPARERNPGVTIVVHGFQLDGNGNSFAVPG